MNEEESKVIMKWHCPLVNELNFKFRMFVDILSERRILSSDEIKHFLAGKDHKQRCSELLILLLDRCNVDRFIGILRQLDISFCENIYKDFSDLEYHVTQTPCKIQIDTKGTDFLESFHDKTLDKLHDGDASDVSNFLTKMLASYLTMYRNGSIALKQRRSIADSCFVLMDALTVRERTYSPNIFSLWQHQLFNQMKKLIADTSNPQLTRIWYHSRYGVALSLGNKREKGLEHVHIALDDIIMMQKSRYLGNCIFAYVNVLLQNYSGQQDEKDLILGLIEWGIGQFIDEGDNTRLRWRHIYLVKKAFCHLGIDIFLKDIPNAVITDCDMQSACTCLEEMERTFQFSNARRKIHYFRAKSKIYLINEEMQKCVECLEKAIEICTKGDFIREKEHLEQIHSFVMSNHFADESGYGTYDGFSREPVQHDELEPN